MSEPFTTPCPFHAEMTAVDTCQRCGSFICVQCKQSNPLYCPKCADRRVAFLFDRENLHLLDLLSAAWNNAFKPFWLELSVGALMMMMIPTIVSYVFQIPVFITSMTSGNLENMVSGSLPMASMMGATFFFSALAYLVQLLLQYVFQRGLLEMANTAWNGQRPAFGVLFNFKAGLKAAVAGFLVAIPGLVLMLLGGLIAFGTTAFHLFSQRAPELPFMGFPIAVLGLTVCAIVAVYLWLMPLVLILPVFAAEPNIGITDAFRLCMERGHGRRLQIFLMLLVCFAITFVGLCACCIGLIPAAAFVFTYQMGFWKALSTPGISSDMPGLSTAR